MSSYDKNSHSEFNLGCATTFGKITTMGSSDDKEIMALLKKAALHTEPILKKRNWKVNLLTEFLPSNPGLWGLNERVGDGIDGIHITIKIRCRHAGTSEIMPYESILETLLHELTHIECAEHDEAFNTLLKALRHESDLCEKEGFLPIICLSGGQKLSTESHNPTSRSELRTKTLSAIDTRQKYSALMSKPTVLGGAKTALSPKEAAAQALFKRLNK